MCQNKKVPIKGYRDKVNVFYPIIKLAVPKSCQL